jgi:hypothetical protein
MIKSVKFVEGKKFNSWADLYPLALTFSSPVTFIFHSVFHICSISYFASFFYIYT